MVTSLRDFFSSFFLVFFVCLFLFFCLFVFFCNFGALDQTKCTNNQRQEESTTSLFPSSALPSLTSLNCGENKPYLLIFYVRFFLSKSLLTLIQLLCHLHSGWVVERVVFSQRYQRSVLETR